MMLTGVLFASVTVVFSYSHMLKDQIQNDLSTFDDGMMYHGEVERNGYHPFHKRDYERDMGAEEEDEDYHPIFGKRDHPIFGKRDYESDMEEEEEEENDYHPIFGKRSHPIFGKRDHPIFGKRGDIRDLTNFQAMALASHNNARRRHGAKDLVYSSTLEAHALAYARVLAATGRFQHDVSDLRSKGEGENLFMGEGPRVFDICEASFEWYNEIRQFDWSKLAFQYNYVGVASTLGHFTQFVWASTSEVGCAGTYVSSQRKTYIVCRYKAAGNMLRKFPANVLPLKSGQPVGFTKYSDVCQSSCADKTGSCPSRARECQAPFFTGDKCRKECPKTCGLC